MPAEYQVRIYGSNGTLRSIVTDELMLAYTRRRNEPGNGAVLLSGDHRAISELERRGQIEIWRRNADYGIDWYCDFYGLFGGYRYTQDARKRCLVKVVGQLAQLSWRIVAWKAETLSRSKFVSTKAESIMKTLVSYNASANATTANGRLRAGTWGDRTINIQTDAAGGNTRDWYCAGDNLLATLQDLARVAGGDFDLVKTAATTWEFRWYAGQLGTDRSSTVTLSVDRGNMTGVVYDYDLASEKTVAVVGGQGEASDRAFVVRTGADYNASTNDVEVFVDARRFSTTAGLEAAGDVAMGKARAAVAFDYKVIQVPSSLYGLHYFLGDKVKAVTPLGNTVTQLVNGVSVTFQPSGDNPETIDPEMINV